MAVTAVMALGLFALGTCSVSPLVSKSAGNRSTDELVKIIRDGDAQAAEEAAATRSPKPSVAVRCGCVLASLKDRRAVLVIADAMIADRGYGGTTWAAADALQGPVVDRLVHMSRGGKGSSRATHVPLYWVLGSYGQLSKDDEDKAREAVIDALYRTGDIQLGFDMWDEGDPRADQGRAGLGALARQVLLPAG